MNPEAISLKDRAQYGEIQFVGEQFLCDHEGAIYWPANKTLIVSDLHLEKGAAMASRGIMVPPYDTAVTLSRLAQCMERWSPETVICLGDSFHRDNSAENLPTSYKIHLKNLMQNCKWVWIAGNHDPVAPAGLGGICLEELSIGPIQFRHEQQCLKDNIRPHSGLQGEISGHLHPIARIERRGKRLRRRCFAGDRQRLIMPAFGAFTGGLSVRSAAFSGLFREQDLRVWMLGRERIYEISGSQLC